MTCLRTKVSVKDIVDFFELYPEHKGMISVKTPYGYKSIEEAEQTDFSAPLKISTKSNSLICSKEHRIRANDSSNDDIFIHAENLSIGDDIDTINGKETITAIESMEKEQPLYDLQVADVEQYFTNGIVSHNSSIFVDSILFGLFGKPQRPIKRSHLRNRNAEGDAYVSVDLDVNDDNYIIKRGFSKNGSTVHVELVENGLQQSFGSADATNTRVEEILKTNWNVFKNCIVLSSNNENSFFKLTKNAKRKFIEEIFSLDVFGNMCSKIKDDIKTTNVELLSLQQVIKRAEKELNELRAGALNYTETSTTKRGELTKLISTQEESIKNAKHEFDEYVSKIESNKKVIDQFDEAHYQKYCDTKTKIESEIKMLNATIISNDKHAKKYKAVLNSISDCCLPNVKSTLKLDIMEETSGENATRINDLKNILLKIEDVIASQSGERENVSKLKSDNIHMSGQQKYIVEKIKNIALDIKRYSAELVAHHDDKNPFSDMVASAEKTLGGNIDKIATFYEQKNYLEASEFIVSDTGVKRFILAEIIETLNSRIHFYLKRLDASYTCMFDSSFDCIFVTETGECSYDNFSTGERARINIAVLFAFREMLFNQGCLSSTLLILDEFLDSGLDDKAINSLMGILREMRESGLLDTIILISHRECVDGNEFDQVISVIKENGNSTIS